MPKLKAKKISGLFVYRDDRGRTVYSGPFQKEAYIINDSDAFSFMMFSFRHIIIVLVGMLLGNFFPEIIAFLIVAGIVIDLVVSALFYKAYLPKLNKVKNFNKPKREGYFEIISKNKKSSLIVLVGIACMALGALIIHYSYSNRQPGLLLYLNYVLGGVIIAFGGAHLLCVIKR